MILPMVPTREAAVMEATIAIKHNFLRAVIPGRAATLMVPDMVRSEVALTRVLDQAISRKTARLAPANQRKPMDGQ